MQQELRKIYLGAFVFLVLMACIFYCLLFKLVQLEKAVHQFSEEVQQLNEKVKEALDD